MSFGSIVLIGILAVLLFGKELPTVGRKFGKTYSDLKRSYTAFRREVNSVVHEATDMSDTALSSDSSGTSPSRKSVDEDEVESVAPKFKLPK